jgi:uncharacterized lipoprotein YddW (UPF0748 family)
VGCISTNPLPHRSRELRGLWVATVNNGDWPSKRDLTSDQQKQELIAIFDRAASIHLNAIFLQVRPMADAFYPSSLEPWSQFLGATPDYDPLAFAVQEAHARRIELHAWFNPFRGNPATTLRSYPYGRFVWMDPGDEAVRQRGLDVIADVVRRYDIDGVHLDDYFYPYPEKDLDFPDEPSWQSYRGPMSRSEWRRDNINRFVRDLYGTVKSIRPSVEVGISPFGIWRPHNPRQIRGLDAYEKIYADSRLWLQQGWVDYLAPQLYWPIEKREQSFPALLHWWSRQDRLGRGIVAGISINRPATRAEIARQLELVRGERQSVGFILFSAHTIMQNTDGIDDVLARELQR